MACSSSFRTTRRQRCARSPGRFCCCLLSLTWTGSVIRSVVAVPSRSPCGTSLSGRGAAPSRISTFNEGADTQRLFSLVWVEGHRPDWTNSEEQTPGDIGRIDAEHAQVSTVRATFGQVHFDGRNRARGDDDPGGPFDPAPDVRNGFGLEGGFADGNFKPVNGALGFKGCRFSDLPGQAGIFAPQLVGSADPAWTFGPDPVKARVIVKDSVFRATDRGVLVPDLSDVEVAVTGSRFQQVAFGIEANTSRQSTSAEGQAIGYPASRRSRVKVNRSRFADTRLAAILVTELGPSLVDLNVVDNALALAAPSQAGIVGFNVEGARLRHNDFRRRGVRRRGCKGLRPLADQQQ